MTNLIIWHSSENSLCIRFAAQLERSIIYHHCIFTKHSSRETEQQKMSLLRLVTVSLARTRPAQNIVVRCLSQEHNDKQFVDKPTPYNRADRQCILCKHKIQLDYRNPRLLSQFVSPLTGKIYDKHITGLCEKQQTVLEVEIRKSRSAMYMPIFYKNPKYNRDPPLFNPDRPQRPNPY